MNLIILNSVILIILTVIVIKMINNSSDTLYEPNKWNHDPIQKYSNCYSYALNDINPGDLDDLHQPGYYAGQQKRKPYMCWDLIQKVLKDNPGIIYKSVHGKPFNFNGNDSTEPPKFYYRVMLFISDSADSANSDYHFVRQDQNGTWSHKPGNSKATNKDFSNNLIINPLEADLGEYKTLCGIFYVPQNNYMTTHSAGRRIVKTK